MTPQPDMLLHRVGELRLAQCSADRIRAYDMAEVKRRKRTQPWKHIYGKDRKYTARIDRMIERDAIAKTAEREAK